MTCCQISHATLQTKHNLVLLITAHVVGTWQREQQEPHLCPVSRRPPSSDGGEVQALHCTLLVATASNLSQASQAHVSWRSLSSNKEATRKKQAFDIPTPPSSLKGP